VQVAATTPTKGIEEDDNDIGDSDVVTRTATSTDSYEDR